VPGGGRGINRTAQAVGERDRYSLAFGGAARQPVDEQVLRLAKDLDRAVNGLLEGGLAPIDLGRRRMLSILGGEPGLREHAGTLRASDAIILDRDGQIIADTTAHGAGNVFNSHCYSTSFSSWR